MKKLFVLLTIALCLASYSLPLSAKEDKNTEITLITGGDTIVCSQTLLDKYGSKKIIQAYNESGLVVNTINSYQYSNWGLKKQKSITIISLIRQDNKVIEITSLPTSGNLYTNWVVICMCIILFFLSFLVMFFNKCAQNFFYQIMIFALSCFILSLFYFFIEHGFWLMAGCNVVSMGLGLLCGYFYKKRKAKKAEKNTLIEEKSNEE